MHTAYCRFIYIYEKAKEEKQGRLMRNTITRREKGVPLQAGREKAREDECTKREGDVVTDISVLGQKKRGLPANRRRGQEMKLASFFFLRLFFVIFLLLRFNGLMLFTISNIIFM